MNENELFHKLELQYNELIKKINNLKDLKNENDLNLIQNEINELKLKIENQEILINDIIEEEKKLNINYNPIVIDAKFEFNNNSEVKIGF